MAGWLVEIPHLGRLGTLAISTGTWFFPLFGFNFRSSYIAHQKGLTGAFILAGTTARSSDALLGWNCGYCTAFLVRAPSVFDKTVQRSQVMSCTVCYMQ